MLDRKQKLKHKREVARNRRRYRQEAKRVSQNLIRESGYTKSELRSRKREAANFILNNNLDLFSKRGLRDFKANFKDEKVGDLLEFYSEDIEIFLLKSIYDMILCRIIEQKNKSKKPKQ